MITMRTLFFAVSILAMIMGLPTSCTSDDEIIEQLEHESSQSERIPRYAEMHLNGGKIAFDAKESRTTTNVWEDQSKIYLQFTVGNDLVDGVATYSSESEQWSVQYYGDLTIGAETKCEAYYFENAGDASFENVILNEHTAIYADKAGIYMFEDNTLTVVANLTPMTGRLRFKGEGVAQDYRFTGIKYYNNYNITTNSFTSTLGTFIAATGEDFYSEYYYGFFPNESNKEIYFEDTENHVSFLKKLGDNALAVGRSGYMDIPTIDNRNGWTLHRYKDITVSNVTFRMVRVLATTNWSYYVQYPHFYIGETEVTQALWKAIMGSTNNPSNFKGDKLPVENMTRNDCLTFIEKLNSKTGLNFSLPTYAEWGYAFKGACISKGYKYSGSNSYDNVAWIDGNGSSTTHEVKTKLPNEIGLYDMSGNVAEINYDSGNYSYGGYYGSSYRYGDYNYGSTTSSIPASYVGFRLCLNP